jgi:hypothetical protein
VLTTRNAGVIIGVVMRIVVFAALVLTARPVHADDATAETLFQEGRALMERGDYEHACPKLLASYHLDAAIGTLLNLALCHERIGQVATAWLEYRAAVATATKLGDDERLRFATERERLVGPRVPHLTIRVAAGMKGTVVVRDGVDVDPVALATPVPIDPGAHEVRARAPGKQDWSRRIDVVDEGSDVAIDVPVLIDTPIAPKLEPTRRVVETGHDRAAFWIGGAGVAVIGGGAVFGVLARSRWNAAKLHCSETPNGLACDSTGLSLSHDASIYASTSTIAIGVGLGTVAAGVVLHLVAPTAKHEILIAPLVRSDGAAVQFTGRF